MATLRDFHKKPTIATAASALVVILGSAAALFAQTPGQQQQPEFVKRAQQLMKEGKPEAAYIVGTMNGEIDPKDSWIFPVPWEDRSYPGMPVKPRPATTIRIEVNAAQRGIRTIWGQYDAMDFPIPDSHRDADLDDEDFALSEAKHCIYALQQASAPTDE